MSTSEAVRYASAEDVLLALDKDPDGVAPYLTNRAETRAASATQKWINRTGRPFHPVRVGNPDDPRSWEVYDAQDALSWQPATVILDNANPLPLDPDEGDTLEIRDGRDSWDDVTSEEGDTWTLDYRRKRLQIYRRRSAFRLRDDPSARFCRITYRYGPLDNEDVTINDDGLVEGVPADVVGAVAAKGAALLTLNDDSTSSTTDNGQLTDRSTKHDALESVWKDTTADYSGFSTM